MVQVSTLNIKYLHYIIVFIYYSYYIIHYLYNKYLHLDVRFITIVYKNELLNVTNITDMSKNSSLVGLLYEMYGFVNIY